MATGTVSGWNWSQAEGFLGVIRFDHVPVASLLGKLILNGLSFHDYRITFGLI